MSLPDISKKSNNSTELNDIGCHSGKAHWVWYLLLVAAGMLIFTALIFNRAFVEHWFSKDHHIEDQGEKYLYFFRCVTLVVASGCIVIFALRNKIINYIRVAVERYKESLFHIDSCSIVPEMCPAGLRQVLAFFLPIWTVFVAISLVPGYDTWAFNLTYENGVTETLTVICYLFAAVMALILAVSSLRRNAQKVFFHLWLFGLAAFCLLVALEETNWGDEYFHYKSVEFIKTINYQQDVSLHNIALPFYGTYWANNLSHILAICGGVLLPLLIRYSKSFRRFLWAVEFPVPTWLSQACFFVAAIIPPERLIHEHLKRLNLPSELREVTIALGFAIWLWATSRNRINQYSDINHNITH